MGACESIIERVPWRRSCAVDFTAHTHFGPNGQHEWHHIEHGGFLLTEFDSVNKESKDGYIADVKALNVVIDSLHEKTLIKGKSEEFENLTHPRNLDSKSTPYVASC